MFSTFYGECAPGETIGAARDLPRTVGKVFHNDEMAKICETMDKLFHQFGTISDATPIGAKSEAVKVRMVTGYYNII